MKMTRTNNQKLHTDNRGVAMITALLVSIVVIMFCVTALTVSYTLFTSATKKVTQDQCRELAKSVSAELQAEIVGVSYGSSEELSDALADKKNLLWLYLRYNICQDSWPSYLEDEETGKPEEGHDKTCAYRYFKMNVTGGSTVAYSAYTDDISVCMYWENEAGTEYETNKNGTYLYIKVTCTRGDESSTMTSRYRLSCVEETSGSESPGESEDSGSSEGPDSGSALKDSTVNPYGNTIDTNEQWEWTFVDRG